jgi:thiol:disulfide interchange protein
MKTILALAASAFAFAMMAGSAFGADDEWLTDYKAALAKAKQEHKAVLLDFTGSDWCPPCMMMKKRVFGSEKFKDFAAKNLVLVELDFPQGKSLPPELEAQNTELAQKFGAMDMTGNLQVPLLVLVNPDGKTLDAHPGAFLFTSEFIDWANETLRRADG